jgi:hypothetical protein
VRQDIRVRRTTGAGRVRRAGTGRVGGAALAVAIAGTVAACGSGHTADAPTTTVGAPTTTAVAPAPEPAAGPVSLGPAALGVNVAAWDSVYTGANVDPINALLQGAGIGLLRFPGGTWADEYNWNTNSDTSKCQGSSPSCASSDPLSYDAFASQTKAIGASQFLTVNYGSGTPAEAASWVSYTNAAHPDGTTLWEVGNESYACYETNQHLAGSPTFVRGYSPNGSVCPPTSVWANSYAVNAVPYLTAMKQADPTAQIGVPWAFNQDETVGAGIHDSAAWNETVLPAVKSEISFVDAHWYPFDSANGLSDQQILATVGAIPAAAADIRSTLHRLDPTAYFVVGETNISTVQSPLDFQPVSALFAAATNLEWLAQGAQTVDWWDLSNFGSPTSGDYGLLSSGAPETTPAGTPMAPYYGEQLASALTTSGSQLEAVNTGSPNLLAFESSLKKQRRVLFVNTNPSAPATVSNKWFTKGQKVDTSTYSAATSGSAQPIVDATITAGSNLSLPAMSIVVESGPTPS